MPSKIYCGAKSKPPAGKRFGTFEECQALGQVFRYGVTPHAGDITYPEGATDLMTNMIWNGNPVGVTADGQYFFIEAGAKKKFVPTDGLVCGQFSLAEPILLDTTRLQKIIAPRIPIAPPLPSDSDIPVAPPIQVDDKPIIATVTSVPHIDHHRRHGPHVAVSPLVSLIFGAYGVLYGEEDATTLLNIIAKILDRDIMHPNDEELLTALRAKGLLSDEDIARYRQLWKQEPGGSETNLKQGGNDLGPNADSILGGIAASSVPIGPGLWQFVMGEMSTEQPDNSGDMQTMNRASDVVKDEIMEQAQVKVEEEQEKLLQQLEDQQSKQAPLVERLSRVAQVIITSWESIGVALTNPNATYTDLEYLNAQIKNEIRRQDEVVSEVRKSDMTEETEAMANETDRQLGELDVYNRQLLQRAQQLREEEKQGGAEPLETIVEEQLSPVQPLPPTAPPLTPDVSPPQETSMEPIAPPLTPPPEPQPPSDEERQRVMQLAEQMEALNNRLNQLASERGELEQQVAQFKQVAEVLKEEPDAPEPAAQKFQEQVVDRVADVHLNNHVDEVSQVLNQVQDENEINESAALLHLPEREQFEVEHDTGREQRRARLKALMASKGIIAGGPRLRTPQQGIELADVYNITDVANNPNNPLGNDVESMEELAEEIAAVYNENGVAPAIDEDLLNRGRGGRIRWDPNQVQELMNAPAAEQDGILFKACGKKHR